MNTQITKKHRDAGRDISRAMMAPLVTGRYPNFCRLHFECREQLRAARVAAREARAASKPYYAREFSNIADDMAKQSRGLLKSCRQSRQTEMRGTS